MKTGTFPFGQPVLPVVQQDRTSKSVFVLGVYASAVHARWIGDDGRQRIGALAVASEPEIFWRGCRESAREIISGIQVPPGSGRLEPAGGHLNGPSGKTLDDSFLKPLGISRQEAWLCDLVPYSCMNENQAKALKREYDPLKKSLNLPDYDWPYLPKELADRERREEIEKEIVLSEASIIITLGDLPLKWFAKHYGAASELSAYGESPDRYGRLHPIRIGDRELHLLPLVHPRQAGRLGTHSARWCQLHELWVANPPVNLPIS